MRAFSKKTQGLKSIILISQKDVLSPRLSHPSCLGTGYLLFAAVPFAQTLKCVRQMCVDGGAGEWQFSVHAEVPIQCRAALAACPALG